jgi:hypothetical protein
MDHSMDGSGRPVNVPAGGREGLLRRALARRHHRAATGMKPQIEFYEVFAITDNARGTVDLFETPALR